MIIWMTENLGTIVVSIILVVIVAFAIRRIVKDRKDGVSSCGGNCAHCKMCSSCRGPDKGGV